MNLFNQLTTPAKQLICGVIKDRLECRITFLKLTTKPTEIAEVLEAVFELQTRASLLKELR